MNQVFHNYDHQTWSEKELIIILNCNKMDIQKWRERASLSPQVSVYQLNEDITLGECLNYGIERAMHDYIAKFDDDDYYAPHYIAHNMDLLRHMKVDVVGKRSVYMYFEDQKILAILKPGKECMFVYHGLKGATLMFKKTIHRSIPFPKLNLGEDTYFIRKCVNHGYRLYAANKYNYVCVRTATQAHHTWNIRNGILLRKSSIVCTTDDYKPLVMP